MQRMINWIMYTPKLSINKNVWDWIVSQILLKEYTAKELYKKAFYDNFLYMYCIPILSIFLKNMDVE